MNTTPLPQNEFGGEYDGFYALRSCRSLSRSVTRNLTKDEFDELKNYVAL